MSERAIHAHASATALPATLFERTFQPHQGAHGGFVHIFILLGGTASVTLDTTGQQLSETAIVILPARAPCTIGLAAGASALMLGASPELLLDALGNDAESVLLRIFVERHAIVSDINEHDLTSITMLARGIIEELGDTGRGSRMALSAYLRLILMKAWRLGGGEAVRERSLGEVTSILQRFRQLVEIHFRERWQIGRYADALGITQDRLHAICCRSLGRAPLLLLHERIIHEASLRLERSSSTIQEISDSLGFSDPTYFSHFFKRRTGQAPGVFRQAHRQQLGQQDVTLGYHDWP
ncbi:MAG: AraC family transcriptional regulator [Paracoccaceae bacterium]